MSLYHRLLLTMAVVSLFAVDASARRSQSPAQPAPMRTYSENGICTLGIRGADDSTRDVMAFDGSDNWLVTLKLNSASCTTCSLGTQGVLEAANISLFLPNAPCTLLVRTRVVRNFATEVCPYPDRFTPNNLCPEFYTTIIAGPEAINTVKDFHIPFPGTGCTILPNQSQFLELNFFSVNPACTSEVARPRIVTSPTRITCQTYNAEESRRFGSDVTSSADLEINNPKIWADILWCESVAVTRRTWGRLKQIYR